jgi:hypothetical protein
MTRLQFQVPDGAADYFRGFGRARRTSGSVAYYCLNGDLNQMGTMEEVLRNAGFDVVRSSDGTYPGFPKEAKAEYHRALKWLFDRDVEGWWNQQLVSEGICTQAEFSAKLEARCQANRAGADSPGGLDSSRVPGICDGAAEPCGGGGALRHRQLFS